MKTIEALHLVKGTKVLYSRNKLVATVQETPSLFTTRQNKKCYHMVGVVLKMKQKNKEVTVTDYCDYRKPYELFVPKPKTRRKIFIEWIAKKLGIEVKVAA